MKQESSSRISTSSTSDVDAGVETTATSPHSFVSDFKKSKAPSRILFFHDETWTDFPRHVSDQLSSRFVAGDPVINLTVNTTPYLFDFLRMICTHLSTRAETSIAWIDVDGRCFFPKKTIMISGQQKQGFDGTEKLSAGDKSYKVVEKLFLNGMRRVNNIGSSDAIVTGVCRYSYMNSTTKAGNMRVRAFRMMMEMVKAERGDANVRFGWYGADKEAVAGVVKHGFGRSNDRALGADAHGVGVHLSPLHFPFASSQLSEADEDGDRHIVLCRVIMGKSERVEAGSTQYHPSSDEFDSGVDDLTNPKWYVVWSTRMNTHLLPEYIVSFKSSSHRQGKTFTLVNSTRRPFIASGLSFQKLLSEIARCLPPSNMQDLEMNYDRLKAGKMSKYAFIRHVRSVAGDKLLASIIKRKIRG